MCNSITEYARFSACMEAVHSRLADLCISTLCLIMVMELGIEIVVQWMHH